jgi:Xaa-Pro aminopeptidase
MTQLTTVRSTATRVPSAGVFAGQSREQYTYQRVSDEEFAARLAAARRFMASHDVDCLLVAGGTGTWDRGWLNTRWIANHAGCQLTNCTYVVVPRQGDVTVLGFPLVAWLPARRAREIVEDVRAAPEPEREAVARLAELGLTGGTIGVIESDLNTSIPSRHWNHFTTALPDATFCFLTREWWQELRTVRSAEEIEGMSRASAVGDAMSAAVAERIRPGMHERMIWAVMAEAMIAAGGEMPTMVLAASAPSTGSWDTFQRERPLDRILAEGDVIVTEISPRWPDGSECQTGRAYSLGDPSPRYREIGDLMLELFARVADQLRPGRTDRDVIEAAGFIKRAGYTWLSPLVHGAEGGGAGALPIIGSSVSQLEAGAFTFEPGMVMTVQAHVGAPDQSAGLFMADSFVTTDGAPQRLNQYTVGFIRIG